MTTNAIPQERAAFVHPHTAHATRIAAAFQMVQAMAEAIRDLQSVPSGHLYARLCGVMDFETFASIIRTLENAKLIETRAGSVLVWTGPEKEGATP